MNLLEVALFATRDLKTHGREEASEFTLLNFHTFPPFFSDFAKCKDDKSSTSRYIFMLLGGVISWRSHKQKLTTASTMMAKYVVVYNATCHGMLLKNLIKGLMIINSIERPLKIYCDNSAAVSFSNNNSSRLAVGLYLDTKYLFERERVEKNDICIEHISTTNMLAVTPYLKIN
ncbi:LOW QUALITY PROTEIN: hypothetical protein OSB04_019636 [Centaurea solstitialis]|uniref:Uncharacterized protein n=1 Tax=Centaurea solstitialis TaxID=347529 RepID=A0AA38SR81_9ASTR|nr:LOW QUALITY PROTEIN: hypothetical protein OSB04_019636 [Centaurea solstitialis]